MTNEEAIKIIDKGLDIGNQMPFLTVDQMNEAKQKAIKALSQQTEDAISRQAVDEAIYDYSRSCDVNYAQIMEYIDKIPSVNPQEPSDISNDGTLTVNVEDGRKISRVLVCGANHWGGLYYPDEQEPKTGHWVVHPKGIYAHLVCDRCLSNAPYDCRTNYCPNCGRRMVEPQESEE